MLESPIDRLRLDVVEALRRLASITAANADDWPDLTNAVHWLIDDTFWDERPPSSDIGRLLRDAAESDAVTAVVEPLLAVLNDLGPTASDAAYLCDARCPRIALAASNAYARLSRIGRRVEQRAELRVYGTEVGPDFDAEHLTQRLSISPSMTWRRGDVAARRG